MLNESVNLKSTNLIKEKALEYGVDSLANNELLTILTSKRNKVEVKDILENEQDVIGFFNNNPIEILSNYFGSNALLIKAIIELYRRRNKKNGYKIIQPKDIFNYLVEDLRYLEKEVLVVLHLDTKNVIKHKEIISMGTLNSSIVHPREVFSNAIKYCSASIIVVHNHPSGDPSPSKEDINVTKRLKESGKIIGIELLDHVIIGDGNFISLKEEGLL